jgi:uncharacterized protein YdeI (YjbR/CyaY-like superfamily)
MQPAGAKAWEGRDQSKGYHYSFELPQVEFEGALLKQIRANKKAWAFFQAQPPYYRKQVTRWVISAKQEETRNKRMAALIKDSAAGRRMGQASGGSAKK